METRREIRYFNRGAMLIRQTGHQHGRVRQVGLLRRYLIQQFYSTITVTFAIGVFIEKGTEDRVSVKTRQTVPDNFASFIDQSTNLTIAN